MTNNFSVFIFSYSRVSFFKIFLLEGNISRKRSVKLSSRADSHIRLLTLHRTIPLPFSRRMKQLFAHTLQTIPTFVPHTNFIYRQLHTYQIINTNIRKNVKHTRHIKVDCAKAEAFIYDPLPIRCMWEIMSPVRL